MPTNADDPSTSWRTIHVCLADARQDADARHDGVVPVGQEGLWQEGLGIAGAQMTMTEPVASLLPPDGRQSPTALAVARGTARLLLRCGFACVGELSLATGRRADLVALAQSGEIWIVEIKSSIEDFRVDRKWPEYRLSCDRLFFATAPHVPLEIFPEDAGLILADAYGAEIMREAPEHRLAAATRKAMMLRFARCAALRLQALADPAGPHHVDC